MEGYDVVVLMKFGIWKCGSNIQIHGVEGCEILGKGFENVDRDAHPCMRFCRL